MSTLDFIPLMKAQFPEGHKGTACELGAADGVFLSNTLGLEQEGWECLCIEANPLYGKRLHSNRPRTLTCGVSEEPGIATFHQYEYDETPSDDTQWVKNSGLESFHNDGYRRMFKVPTLPLSIILPACHMAHLDFLSLDVEGHELKVLRSLGPIRPRCILVEIAYNKDAITSILQEWGYTLLHSDPQDALFLRKD